MSSIALQVLLVVVLVLVNGVFAMSELAVVSARKARLRQRADEGSAAARVALHLAENPDRFLSTVQIGITMVGIFAGAFGGAMLAEPLSDLIDRYPPLDPYSEELALTIVVVSITYLSLIVGELVPKRIALHSPERVATLIAPPMRLLSTVAYPLVWILTRSTDIVLRLVRLRDSSEPRVTVEEISHLLHEGAEAGVIERAEHALVERVFRFADRDVGLVMTPRVDIEFIDLEAPADLSRAKLAAARNVRLVACRGGLDHAVGVIDVRDLLGRALAGEPLDLEAAVRPAHFVPEHVPALRVLDHLRRTGERLAVVLDEYGGTAGIVTADDLLEALIGPIPAGYGDEHDPLFVKREDGSYLVDGQATTDELRDRLRLKTITGEEEDEFRTAAGWVVTRLGRIPDVGDTFEADGLRVEVVDMDGPRVDRLLIARIPGGAATAESA